VQNRLGELLWLQLVEGDRRISRKRKGKVFSSCVARTCTYDRDDGTNRNTTTEGAGLDKKNCSS